MAKRIYMFGAGASATYLPLVSEMFVDDHVLFDRLHEEHILPDKKRSLLSVNSILHVLKGYRDLNYMNNDFEVREHSLLKNSEKVILDIIIKDLEFVVDLKRDPTFENATIDELAKIHYIKKDFTSVDRIKSSLNFYLSILQSLFEPDSRYRSLITKIHGLEDKFVLLNWNYDNCISNTMNLIGEQSLPSNIELNQLNGHCRWRFQRLLRTGSIGKRILLNTINSLSENESYYYDTRIKFAWEHNENLEKLKIEVQEASELVIIGYSLPDYNNRIDQLLFRHMVNLNHVIIQNTEALHQSVKEKFSEKLDLWNITPFGKIRSKDSRDFHIT